MFAPLLHVHEGRIRALLSGNKGQSGRITGAAANVLGGKHAFWRDGGTRAIFGVVGVSADCPDAVAVGGVKHIVDGSAKRLVKEVGGMITAGFHAITDAARRSP